MHRWVKSRDRHRFFVRRLAVRLRRGPGLGTRAFRRCDVFFDGAMLFVRRWGLENQGPASFANKSGSDSACPRARPRPVPSPSQPVPGTSFSTELAFSRRSWLVSRRRFLYFDGGKVLLVKGTHWARKRAPRGHLGDSSGTSRNPKLFFRTWIGTFVSTVAVLFWTVACLRARPRPVPSPSPARPRDQFLDGVCVFLTELACVTHRERGSGL